MAQAYGLADRANQVANTADTRFGIASGTKAMTAVVVMSLVQDGVLGMSTTARSLLGDDLPLVDDAVTVEQRQVCTPAGMTRSLFARSDDLPPGTATGYLGLADDRTNVLHMPLRGVGDGGLHAPVEDLHRFWAALHGGGLVPGATLAEMVRPRHEDPDEGLRSGLGFWLLPTDRTVVLAGYDPGISFRSCHDPARALTWTVVSNTSEGAWPVARALEAALTDDWSMY